MPLDFPEEKPADAAQSEPILIPPVFATIQQVEEVNRQLTATIMAMWRLLQDCGIEIKAGEVRPLNTILSLYREDVLKELDRKLEANLQRVVGPDRDKQVKYLQRYPEAILFSGEFARKE